MAIDRGAQLDFEREPGSMDFSDSWRIRTSPELCGENGGNFYAVTERAGHASIGFPTNIAGCCIARPTDLSTSPSPGSANDEGGGKK